MSRFPAYPRHSRSAERWRGQETVWGKEGILPPASPRLDRARPTGSANSLSRFHIRVVCGVAFVIGFRIARLRRRSSFSHGRPSGNVRGSNANALDPPSRSRAN